MRLPWKDIARAAPIALRAADRLLRPDPRLPERNDPPPSVWPLAERLERLEAASVSQGDLVREVAGQNREVGRTLRVLGIQLLVAIALAAAALGVAIVALVRTF
jgi:hypothetical protein